ncbi:unnamed protein product, partial [Symbiodinium necroappetens]
ARAPRAPAAPLAWHRADGGVLRGFCPCIEPEPPRVPTARARVACRCKLAAGASEGACVLGRWAGVAPEPREPFILLAIPQRAPGAPALSGHHQREEAVARAANIDKAGRGTRGAPA